VAIRPRITVLGSLNMDISVTVPRLPGPGSTVLGSEARFTPGGKGANQAVAASRLGADVRMVGCVADDEFGHRLLDALAAAGVDADGVRDLDGVSTGLAMIAVDESGENLITVAQGANHEVGAEDVERALALPADALVISAEIPIPAIISALTKPAGTSLIRILNLAPAPADAAAIVAAATSLDWLVVNESEAAAVLGRPVDGLAEAARAAADLVAVGARHAVVTAGPHGAALAGPGAGPPADAALPSPAAPPAGTSAPPAGTSAPPAALASTLGPVSPGGAATLTVPGFHVTAVDSVGAGDTFVGALAVALAAGVPAAEAVRAAAAAAAAAVTRPGAQTAMPRPADILTLTGLNWPVG
jgi:ribokinase